MSADYQPITRANSVQSLITEGLGYCCEWFFWGQFEKVSADSIAARLGVTPDTIRRHRLWFREGRFTCKCKKDCIKLRLEAIHGNAAHSNSSSHRNETESLSDPVLPDAGGVSGGEETS